MNALLCFRVGGSGMKTTLAVTTAWFALSWVVLADPCTNRADILFVANYGNNTIVKINSSGTITVFASSGIDEPSAAGLAFDSAGNLYVSNYSYDNNGNGTIEKFNSSGVGTLFANVSSYPQGIAFNTAGVLFDSFGGGNIGMIPGGYFYDAGPTPIGLAFDKNGNLYLAIQVPEYVGGPESGFIEEVNTNRVGWIFPGSGLVWPAGLAFDENGNLYVANSGNGTIVEFDTNGVGTVFASGLNSPQGLAFDSAGNLYVADSGDGTIEEFDTNGVGTVFASGLDQPVSIAIHVPRLTITVLGDNPLTNECHTTFLTGFGSVGRRNRFEQQYRRKWDGKRQGARYVHPDLHCHGRVLQNWHGDTHSYCGGAYTAVISCPANIVVNAASPNGAFVVCAHRDRCMPHGQRYQHPIQRQPVCHW